MVAALHSKVLAAPHKQGWHAAAVDGAIHAAWRVHLLVAGLAASNQVGRQPQPQPSVPRNGQPQMVAALIGLRGKVRCCAAKVVLEVGGGQDGAKIGDVAMRAKVVALAQLHPRQRRARGVRRLPDGR